jgi:hypothetical protein
MSSNSSTLRYKDVREWHRNHNFLATSIEKVFTTFAACSIFSLFQMIMNCCLSKIATKDQGEWEVVMVEKTKFRAITVDERKLCHFGERAQKNEPARIYE